MSTKLLQSSLDDKAVFLGLWTNWSQGSIAGLTLTTTIQNGGLLIAFLALFVTFSGTCCWSITSFLIHQMLSRRYPQNAIYHQKQAILRNADTSATALWRLTRLLWAWRRRGLIRKRLAWPLTVSLIMSIAFAVAGVFSSRVAITRGGEVLLVGDKCASLNASLFTPETLGMGQSYLANRIKSSANYASRCYTDSGSAESCRTFVRSNLPFSSTRNVECPFPGKTRICLSSHGAIRLDSGYLNSHHDLGINAPLSQRFLYRSVNECAPLRGEEYVRKNMTSSPNTIEMWYGARSGYCLDPSSNCTADFNLDNDDRLFRRVEYSASIVTRYDGTDEYATLFNTWHPIPELLKSDADTSIIFLESHDIPFLYAPVHDPWFSASQGPFNRSVFGDTVPYYLGDESVSVLACVQQYQFCNAAVEGNASCTPLLGIFQASSTASATIFPELKQREAFAWSAKAITNMAGGFNEIIGQLGGSSLLASDSLTESGQSPLPDNQWELELEHLFKFTMADIQRAILDLATGPQSTDSRQFHSPPDNAKARALCGSQKIRSDSFTSFSVLGLVLILSIGGLIMIVSVLLPWTMERMRRHRNPLPSVEWNMNEILQLQRLAHEAVGAGDWDDVSSDYPLTRKGEFLACLDIADPKHPLLRPAETNVSICSQDHSRTSEDEKDSGSEMTSEPMDAFLLDHNIPRASFDLDRLSTDHTSPTYQDFSSEEVSVNTERTV
ncbi:hypothetical protein FB567DRAFT_183030 [Paraphoma chrysanthemicola]|uniref:Uncharacterized protein n=1 Tax=Paraphoma chrysanthemicola TaxID=798071 RepID=A0A8K0QWL1_9PLEO|nr:hypothetical protein FB567DRAFT_183030 [Paraphoma chrysanthemicola]